MVKKKKAILISKRILTTSLTVAFDPLKPQFFQSQEPQSHGYQSTDSPLFGEPHLHPTILYYTFLKHISHYTVLVHNATSTIKLLESNLKEHGQSLTMV